MMSTKSRINRHFGYENIKVGYRVEQCPTSLDIDNTDPAATVHASVTYMLGEGGVGGTDVRRGSGHGKAFERVNRPMRKAFAAIHASVGVGSQLLLKCFVRDGGVGQRGGTRRVGRCEKWPRGRVSGLPTLISG